MNSASTLEFALVGLLRQKAQSGYDLRKTFTETAMRHYSDSPGSIYPALRRLEVRGWIAVERPATPQPPDRRGRTVYRPTAEGSAALVEWLSQPVTRDGVIFRLGELMLRFAFMDGNVPRATTVRFLDQFAAALAAYVEELRAKFELTASQLRTAFKLDSTQMPIHTGLFAFQSGIESMEAQVSWARRARALFAEELP
jgi:DNA-binding PadR family transcriptional regulator